MDDGDSMWSRKGATLSDKSARQEFGLSQQEIIAAIRVGKLQFRESNMHGNPWYRLTNRIYVTAVSSHIRKARATFKQS